MSDKLLRPSCYRCSCKGLSRTSDITLADFWGVNRLMPDMFDNKGTSLIFVNTEKGKRLFADVQGSCKYKEVSIDDAIKNNSAAYVSPPYPTNRRKIIKMLDTADFEALKSACVKRSLFEKVQRKVHRKLFRTKKIR